MKKKLMSALVTLAMYGRLLTPTVAHGYWGCTVTECESDSVCVTVSGTTAYGAGYTTQYLDVWFDMSNLIPDYRDSDPARIRTSVRASFKESFTFTVKDTSKPSWIYVCNPDGDTSAGEYFTIPATRTNQFDVGDVDGDGSITVMDAQYTLKYYTCNTVAGMNLTWDQILGKEVNG